MHVAHIERKPDGRVVTAFPTATGKKKTSKYAENIRISWDCNMSPTVFRENGFRFFFFSREELRMHVHVVSGDGEAKFWLEPEIELTKNYNYSRKQL